MRHIDVAREERGREDRLLALLASTAPVRATCRDEMVALAKQVGAGPLWRSMHLHHLVPLLGTRLIELLGDRTPHELALRVERAVELNRRRGRTLEMLTVDISRRLEREGIPALPLKGAHLAARIHGDCGLRSAGDIDILVDPEHLDAAAAILGAAGWGAPSDPRWEAGLPLLHLSLPPSRRWQPPVEVHWRIHWLEPAFSKRLLERSRPDARFGRIADPNDELAALLAFYARDSFYRLRLLADIAAFWDVHREQLATAVLAPVLDAYPALRRSLVAAAELAHTLVGVPRAELLPPGAALDRTGDLAVRLADWHGRSTGLEAVSDLTLIELLLTPGRERSGWLRRNILQPLDHVGRERDREDAPRVELAARGGLHAAAATARFVPRFASSVRRGRRAGRPSMVSMEVR